MKDIDPTNWGINPDQAFPWFGVRTTDKTNHQTNKCQTAIAFELDQFGIELNMARVSDQTTDDFAARILDKMRELIADLENKQSYILTHLITSQTCKPNP